MFTVFFFGFLTFSSTLMISGVYASNSVENSWEQMASMPTDRGGFGVATVNGKIYAVGGAKNLVTIFSNEVYDPATNTWATKKPLPNDCLGVDFCTVTCNNKIYVLNQLKVYDIDTDSWASIPQPSASGWGSSASVVNGKIYWMGGITGEGLAQTYSEANEMYNPETNTWTDKAPIPYYYLDHIVTVALDNKIYLFGTNDLPHNETFYVQIYDPQTNTWQTGSVIPQKVYSGAATTGVYAPKKIYLFTEDNLIIFDPQTQTWSNSNSSSPTGSISSVTVVDDILYAFDGHENWRYTPFGYVSPEPAATSPPATLGATPTNQITQQNPSTLTFTIAGISVAVAVLVAISLLFYRKKNKTPKQTTQPT
jgi:hypothetical protein